MIPYRYLPWQGYVQGKAEKILPAAAEAAFRSLRIHSAPLAHDLFSHIPPPWLSICPSHGLFACPHRTQQKTTNVNSSVPNANEEGKASFCNEYSYAKDTGLLTHVGHNTTTDECDVTYTFSYDALGRRTSVKVGAVELSRNEYQNDAGTPNYGTLKKMVYGNGHTVENAYDDFNRVTAVHYNGETMPRYEYAYNAKGQVVHVTYNTTDAEGSSTQFVTESEYDLSNRPVRVKEHENGKHVYTGEVAYNDTFGVLSEFREKVGENQQEYVTTFSYDSQNRPVALNYGTSGGSTTTLDALNCMTYSSVKLGDTAFQSEYHFVADGYGSGSLTGLVSSITQTGGHCSYGYDDNGNIANATVNGKWAGYTYDALGQLIRVNDRSDIRAGSTGSTWVYEYDRGGNILSKKLYPYADTSSEPLLTTRFTYGNANWKDQLTAVDGVAITYDAQNRPVVVVYNGVPYVRICRAMSLRFWMQMCSSNLSLFAKRYQLPPMVCEEITELLARMKIR